MCSVWASCNIFSLGGLSFDDWQIEASLQTRQYLSETRAQLHEMVRTLNVQESTLATVSVVCNLTYSYDIIVSSIVILVLEGMFLAVIERDQLCGSCDIP